MTDDDIEPIEWKIERWKLKDLKGFPNNPRVLSKHMYRELKKSLEQDGNHGVLKLNADGTIIGGNQRAKLLRDLGEKEVDVKVSTRQLTDEEALRINLRDNKVQADFDIDMLANYYDPNVLVDSGFTPEEMGGFNPTVVEEIESEEGDDDAPEPPKEPETKKGDIYELGEHRLMCGDSVSITDVEKLMNGKKASFMFTDPPYNLASENKLVAADSNNKMAGKLKASEWDKNFNIVEFLDTALPFLKEDCSVNICTSHHLAPDIWKWMASWSNHHSYCVWAKTNPMPSLMKRHWTWNTELICYATRGKHIFNFPKEGHALSTWDMSKVAVCDLHPTMKPVSLVVHAIQHSSNKGQNILDLFGGSGSTLIACEQTKRKCFMMELSPNYCDVIVKRWVEYRKKNGRDCVVKRNGLEVDSEIFNKANKKRT